MTTKGKETGPTKGKEAGPGWPSFIEEKPVGYHEKPCSIWQRLPYNSVTSGVSLMWLEGREAYMVERMRGMTPERRAHRKQFLQDQILSAREPVYVPELERELYHPLRRAYRYPLAALVKFLEPKIGYDMSKFVKRSIRNHLTLICLVYGVTYLGLFYVNNWIFNKRLGFHRSKPVVFPGDPDYPYTSPKNVGEDYYDLGFRASSFYQTKEQVLAAEAATKKAEELRLSRMIRKEYI